MNKGKLLMLIAPLMLIAMTGRAQESDSRISDPLSGGDSCRHMIALRTNLIHDILMVPDFGFAYGINLQAEYYPQQGHYTYNIGFTFTNHRHWSERKFFQIRDLQLEARRYFKGGGDFSGAYMGLYAQGIRYCIAFSKSRSWEGEGVGTGLSGGYVWPLNTRGNFRMEVSANIGFFYTHYHPFVYGDPETGVEDGFYYYDYEIVDNRMQKRNEHLLWFGPTNIGIHLTYDIIYRKKGGSR